MDCRDIFTLDFQILFQGGESLDIISPDLCRRNFVKGDALAGPGDDLDDGGVLDILSVIETFRCVDADALCFFNIRDASELKGHKGDNQRFGNQFH